MITRSFTAKNWEPEGKKRKQIEEEEETIIHVGDVVNLSDLLFTDTRDYLIKYKDNQQVKDTQLAGKVVVLLFVSLVKGHEYWKSYFADLSDVYNKLEPKGGFEIIFVAVKDDDDTVPCSNDNTRESKSTYSTRFEECFSTMPWTAIPFSDSKSRKRLERKFGAFKHRSFVIDPRGVVVNHDAINLSKRYGVAGFPYTKERIEWLYRQDKVARMQLSVETLLASPERDYVITNKGEQVPLHKLKDKVVGLFFFTETLSECITSKLKMVYEELSKSAKNFEVVLINLLPISSDKYCEDALWKTFETVPWLAIPFKDTDCSKKLVRIFEHALCDYGPHIISSKLVIIGPHGKFIEPFGAQIMMLYGIPAYPFTSFSAVSLEIKRAKGVKPEMLWNRDSLFRKRNGSLVRFSRIVGKRMIVLFERCYRGIREHTLNKLKALYIQMKGTDDEFEVIHICSTWTFEGGAPGWLIQPFSNIDSDTAGHVITSNFSGDCNRLGLVAFDRDGTLVRMTQSPEIGKMDFPFYEGDDMEDEVSCIVEASVNERIKTLWDWW